MHSNQPYDNVTTLPDSYSSDIWKKLLINMYKMSCSFSSVIDHKEERNDRIFFLLLFSVHSQSLREESNVSILIIKGRRIDQITS